MTANTEKTDGLYKKYLNNALYGALTRKYDEEFQDVITDIIKSTPSPSERQALLYKWMFDQGARDSVL